MRSSIGETQIHPQESRSGVSGRSTGLRQAPAQYTTRLLTPDTLEDFAALVEANNLVWGGCWCIGFHPEGISKDSTVVGNREAKLGHVNKGTIHQLPAVLAGSAQAGGGLIETHPEQVVGRDPQRGAYLHTGPESLFEEFGFVRDRRIAKWRWVMRLRISA
jgi:hypothetical protein